MLFADFMLNLSIKVMFFENYDGKKKIMINEQI